VEAIKGNEHCKRERKEYNLIASTPVGKYIDPNLAKKQAVALLNCFEDMYDGGLPCRKRNETTEQKAKKQLAVESLRQGKNSESLIDSYLKS